MRIDRDLRRVRINVLRLRGVRPQVAVEAVVLASNTRAWQLVASRRRRETESDAARDGAGQYAPSGIDEREKRFI